MDQIKTAEKFAIFQTGGKQYQAVEGKTLAIEKIEGQPGDTLEFKEVLFKKTGEGAFVIGQPFVTGAIQATIVKQTKGDKVFTLRFKRRKKVRVQKNHRQEYTVVRIQSV